MLWGDVESGQDVLTPGSSTATVAKESLALMTGGRIDWEGYPSPRRHHEAME